MRYRIFLIYFLLVLLPAFSYSQRNERGFKSGISCGLVFSQVDGDSFSGYEKMGSQVGIFSKYIIDDNFSSHIGIKYIQKGSKKVNQDNGVYFKLKFDYIEIPVLIDYKVNDKTFIEGGIGIGYLFSAGIDPDGGGSADAFGVYDDLKKYELSVIFGGGYYLSDKWMVNAHYSYSILPVLPHPGGQTYFTDLGCYNNLIGASLNYIF
jgi:outer membrane scaffolding protein for murein synthesis (MipA/OmpV family)